MITMLMIFILWVCVLCSLVCFAKLINDFNQKSVGMTLIVLSVSLTLAFVFSLIVFYEIVISLIVLKM